MKTQSINLFLYSLVAVLLIVVNTSQAQRFQSKYFDFATESKNVTSKAEIKKVPDIVDDNMVYYCRTGIYDGRQIVYKGVTAKALIRGAYQATDARIIWNKEMPPNTYIAEIIVPEADQELLFEEFIKAVDQKFNTITKKEVRLIELLELNIIQEQSIQFEKTDASQVRWSQEDGEISGVGITINMLSQIIERVTKQKPVFSNIDDGKRYAIDLKWEAGNVEDLNSKLKEYGLELVTNEKEVELLIVNPIK